MKTCRDCAVSKPLNAFYRHSNTRDGLHNSCKPCFGARSEANRRARLATNPVAEKAKAAARSRRYCQRNAGRARGVAKYGISRADYERMHSTQNGLCAICHQPETHRIRGFASRLSVDHDHSTGRVRALLCAKCNKALGLAGEDASVLRAMIDYLESHNAVK